jgi:hypothetical protein
MKRRLPKPKSADALSLVEAESEPPAAPNTVSVDAQLFPRHGRSGGSTEESFNIAIIENIANASIKQSALRDKNKAQKSVGVVVTALAAFDAQDEIEGMIASQAIALHFATMEALRRAMIDDQPAEIAARLRKDGANLARAMVDMVEAVDRKRGKAQQVVRVERVVVEDGGQAIVGNVNGGRP